LITFIYLSIIEGETEPEMEDIKEKMVWTIGHSTHPLEEFIDILFSFSIERIIDIRRFPGSRRFPHFNKQALEISLPQHGIQYTHLEDLGGRRNPTSDAANSVWRVKAFRGYADYMETQGFISAIEELEKLAIRERCAYMCSEAVWWSCHRALVSDYLKSKGWTVLHILGLNKAQEHPYTKPASVVQGILRYDNS
jgi:uncharacterized protein (DUF488 family)